MAQKENSTDTSCGSVCVLEILGRMTYTFSPELPDFKQGCIKNSYSLTLAMAAVFLIDHLWFGGKLH